jgi:hypothetical protein
LTASFNIHKQSIFLLWLMPPVTWELDTWSIMWDLKHGERHGILHIQENRWVKGNTSRKIHTSQTWDH